MHTASREECKGAVMDTHYIVATIYPKPGKEEAVQAAILANISLVRKEKGCLRYDLHISGDGGTRFMFYEIWADKSAFEAHGAAPHMAAYRERIKDLLEKPTEVSVWFAVEETAVRDIRPVTA
jgi:quinol monooxygenase YgiN